MLIARKRAMTSAGISYHTECVLGKRRRDEDEDEDEYPYKRCCIRPVAVQIEASTPIQVNVAKRVVQNNWMNDLRRRKIVDRRKATEKVMSELSSVSMICTEAPWLKEAMAHVANANYYNDIFNDKYSRDHR